MTTDRRRVLDLFHQALGRDTESRAAFLREATAGDEALCREVESMLAQQPSADFLGAPTTVAGAGPGPVDGVRDLVGRHIGPYEILSAIGAGGMGEVYRARDARLGREVAVKVLPAGLSADPDRLRRFE